MKIKDAIQSHKKIVENYFFMTFLQGANILISLLLYPYLIRTLGAEVYGTYVFVFSNVQFFNILIAFGFGMTGLKSISMNVENSSIISRALSEIFTARVCLWGVCGILFATLFFIPFVQNHSFLYVIIFTSTIVTVLFPDSYFQALQKSKHVTYINITVRLLTIPFIFLFVKSPDDVVLFAAIVSLMPLLGAVYAFLYINFVDKNKIKFVSLCALKPIFTEAQPLFLSNALERAKQETVTFVLGSFLGMSSVALWDLAQKIVSLPKFLTNNINNALFPGVINNLTKERVHKILKFNKKLGVAMTLLIALCGYWAVLILGGEAMIAAFPLLVILSATIYTNLLSDCYFNFVFVPQNRYSLAYKNQLVSLLTFVALAIIGIFFLQNILFFVVAFTISCFVEVLYCRYVIAKYHL